MGGRGRFISFLAWGPGRRSANRGCWSAVVLRLCTRRFPVEAPSETDTASPKSLAAPVAWVPWQMGLGGAGGCNKGSGAQLLQSMGESFPSIFRLLPVYSRLWSPVYPVPATLSYTRVYRSPAADSGPRVTTERFPSPEDLWEQEGSLLGGGKNLCSQQQRRFPLLGSSLGVTPSSTMPLVGLPRSPGRRREGPRHSKYASLSRSSARSHGPSDRAFRFLTRPHQNGPIEPSIGKEKRKKKGKEGGKECAGLVSICATARSCSDFLSFSVICDL